MTRHLLDLPADVDKVHLLCGPYLDGKATQRGDLVAGDPALCNCIPCLRAHAVREGHKLTILEEKLSKARAELENTVSGVTLAMAEKRLAEARAYAVELEKMVTPANARRAYKSLPEALRVSDYNQSPEALVPNAWRAPTATAAGRAPRGTGRREPP